MKKWKEQ